MTVPLISLDEIKEFCRIDDDLDAASGSLLEGFREAAIDAGEHLTNRDWTAEWTPVNLPPALKVWTLNRIASLYDLRGDVQESGKAIKTPRTHVDGLLDRWVNYGERK